MNLLQELRHIILDGSNISIIPLSKGNRIFHFLSSRKDGLMSPIPPFDAFEFFYDFLWKTIFHNVRRIANDNRIRRYIFCNNRLRTDDSAISNPDAAKDGRTCANPDIVADNNLVMIIFIGMIGLAIRMRFHGGKIIEWIRRNFTMQMIETQDEFHTMRQRTVSSNQKMCAKTPRLKTSIHQIRICSNRRNNFGISTKFYTKVRNVRLWFSIF